jgi:beta-lactam-binding protein with PASTA domain
VPSVENLDLASAKQVLREAKFKVAVQYQDTDDPALDGTVIAQDPASGTKAPAGTTVTLTVGRLVTTTTTTTAPGPIP